MRRKLLPLCLAWALAGSCASQPSLDAPLPGKVVRTDIENVSITDFCEDRSGYLWMASHSAGAFWYSGDIFIQHFSVPGDESTLPSAFITNIEKDANGNLWVGTNNGLCRWDYETGVFRHYQLADNDAFINSFIPYNADFFVLTNWKLYRYDSGADMFSPVFDLPQRQTQANHIILVDRMNKIWLRYDNHICCYDADFVPVEQFDFPAPVNNFVYDGRDRLWFTVNGTIHALNVLTVKELNNLDAPRLPKTEAIRKIAEQELLFFSEEQAWFLDSKTGITCPATDNACPYRDELPLLRNGVFHVDDRGLLWIALPEGGFKIVTPRMTDAGDGTGLLGLISSNQIVSSATNGTFYWVILRNGILQTYESASQRLLGSSPLLSLIDRDWSAPTIKYAQNGELLVSNIISQEVFTLSIGPDGLPRRGRHIQAEINLVADIAADGTIWASSPGGRIYKSAPGYASGEEVVLEDTGLLLPNPFSFPDLATTLPDGSFLVMQTDNHPHLIRSGAIIDLCPNEPNWQVYYRDYCIDNQGDVWIGTNLNGLYHYSEGGTLTHVDEVENRSVVQLIKDKDGTLFATTEQDNGSYGIYTRKEGGHWSKIREMGSREKDTCRLILLPSGVVILAINGRIFYLTQTEDVPNPLFSQSVTVVFASGDNVLGITKAQPDTKGRKAYSLKKQPDNFSIYLSSQDYTIFQPYGFVYKQDNFRNGFQQIARGHPIPLYNLSYGRNRLSFMLQGLGGTDGGDVYQCSLYFRRPFYHYLIFVLFILLASGLTYLFFIIRRKQEEAEKERRNREIQETINEKNMEFFSNISHEFRSPLTVINGAVSNLETNNGSSSDRHKSIQIIRRNTDRMLKLISQLLDFNKLDNGMLKLHVKAEDLAELITRVSGSFLIGARQKNVDLELEGCEDPFIAWLDADKIEKVLYNLMSNALKFTPAGGRIMISLAAVDGDAVVTVADTGIGIPEDMTEAIFNRFVQAGEAGRSGGTGVGLYYTRSLINLHHGEIHARNRKDGDGGTGAEFTFRLPIEPGAYTEQEIAQETDTNDPADQINSNGEYIREEFTPPNANRPTVLLIDDDYEFIYYLKSVLSHDYNVAFRFDAMSGYKVIEEINPDIIISDIMMMDVDGLQLCKMIKENILISHIPVIMLTAKSTVEDQIQSLNVGADAYLTKPFMLDHLLALMGSMIANRRRIMSLLTSSTTPPQAEKKDTLGERDRDFISKVYDYMESSLQDGELNIDGIVARLGISRTKFFYKMKSLTGQTPNDFFNTYRLNYAAKLLKMNKYKISAIAEMVGFGSSSHFSLLFKKQFGMLPSQYIDEGY